MALTENFDLWAVVDNGTIMAIGQMPYFAVDQSTGKRVQVRGNYDPTDAAAQTELATRFNLYPVWSENRKDFFDPDLEREITPNDYIDTDGKVVRQHQYDLHPDARARMISKLNSKAERERIAIAASYGGQMREYIETEREAFAFLALSVDQRGAAQPSDWPYLKSGLGNDKTETGAMVTTLEEEARVVKLRSQQWRGALVTVRDARKKALALIEFADTDAQALQSYYRAFSNHNQAMFSSIERANFI